MAESNVGKWIPWKGFCTAWPDLWYGDCCRSHDEAYRWAGGKRRWEADLRLWHCVHASTYSKKLPWCLKPIGRLIAMMMFHGVRLFGWAFYEGNQTSITLGE